MSEQNIDWNKVPPGTRVVGYEEIKGLFEGQEGLFAGYYDTFVFPFVVFAGKYQHFTHCKLASTTVLKPEWIKS